MYYNFRRPSRAERVMAQEEEILLIIKDYYSKKGYSPTVREIAKKSQVSSTSTVLRYLKRLQDKGKISWETKMPRTIKVNTNIILK